MSTSKSTEAKVQTVATNFLLQLAPQGPWQLTAISPDQQKLETETFGKIEAARKWIADRAGKVNLYYTANSIKGSPDKKPQKTDIKDGRALYVDLDYNDPGKKVPNAPPMTREYQKAERKRIDELLTKKLPVGVPPPTGVIFTGGGYQAIWMLQQPFPIDGQQDAWEEYERYNRWLVAAFGADACWNCDRILRLPGTANIPAKKKADRGRITEMATVVRWSSGVSYPLKALQQAPAVRPGIDVSSRPGTGPAKVPDISARKLDTLEQLDEWKVPGLCKTVIAQGIDPDEPNRFESGSEAQWYVTLELTRRGVPEDLILGIIADGTWAISGHVCRQKNPHSYALMQIAKAKEAAEDPELAEFSSQYFVLRDPRGTRICNWEVNQEDPSGRDLLFQHPVPDFHTWKSNVKVTRKIGKEEKEVALSKLWFSSPKRKQFNGLFFDPSRPPVDNGHLNLWRGLAIEPKVGSWRRMRRHIWKVLAKRDKASFKYIVRWAAWALRHPGDLTETALVFRGRQGAGKGTFARALVKLFGQHGFQTASAAQFTGRFNSHLRDCCLLFADEAVAADDKAAESVLKGMITEPSLAIEGKGRDIVKAGNHVKIVMASNHDWVVSVDGDDRRFAVFDVAPAPGDADVRKAYFAELYAELNAGGYAAMLHDLLQVDLAKFDPRDIPETEARAEQKEASRSPYYETLEEYLEGIADGRMRVTTAQSIIFGDVKDIDGKKQRQLKKALNELGWFKKPIDGRGVKGKFYVIGDEHANPEWTLALLRDRAGRPTSNVVTGPFGQKATQSTLPLDRKR